MIARKTAHQERGRPVDYATNGPVGRALVKSTEKVDDTVQIKAHIDHQTRLVPNTVDLVERIQNVPAVIKTNLAHGGCCAGVRELVRLERIVKTPITAKPFKMISDGDENACAGRILL